MKTILLKLIFVSIIITLFNSCSSTKEVHRYEETSGKLFETGIASWYGPNFNGKQTANGEIFNMDKLTAAHRTLPFGSIVKVVNLSNGKTVIVRINDRGPYAKNRIIDLSKKAAEEINIIKNGTAKVNLFLLSKNKIPKSLKKPHYSIQIGSFTKQNEAIKISSKVKNSRVVKVRINGEIYYRVYVGLFSIASEAEKLKKKLYQNGITGFVKQVNN